MPGPMYVLPLIASFCKLLLAGVPPVRVCTWANAFVLITISAAPKAAANTPKARGLNRLFKWPDIVDTPQYSSASWVSYQNRSYASVGRAHVADHVAGIPARG